MNQPGIGSVTRAFEDRQPVEQRVAIPAIPGYPPSLRADILMGQIGGRVGVDVNAWHGPARPELLHYGLSEPDQDVSRRFAPPRRFTLRYPHHHSRRRWSAAMQDHCRTQQRRTALFSKIMVPIDLVHAARQVRALAVAADLAKHYGAELVYVAVTAPTPGPMGRNPEDFAAHLGEFAQSQAATHGLNASSHAEISHDPAVDLDDALLNARRQTGADLVVMASHVPGVADFLLPSHGGRMASHAGVSVMVVREED